MRAIAKPYLLFVADIDTALDAKTAFGLKDWAPQDCLAQYRLRVPPKIDLGLPDMTPAQAVGAGAKTLVVGIAPVGGRIPESWVETFAQALEAGLDLAAGLHDRLRNNPRLMELATRLGRTLHDVRDPPPSLPVGTGRKRPGKRLLTVGTDCALGKKYTALALCRALHERGVPATFRATGQTGILIAGAGVPMDAVVADFVSGAAEMLSPANDPGHWDVIEGQGAIHHPGYGAVTLGLIYGSQPDALVLCHDPTRRELDGFPGFPIPSLEQAMASYVAAARVTNPAAKFVGVSLNTSALSEAEAAAALAEAARRTGLPCGDPMRGGLSAIVDALLA